MEIVPTPSPQVVELRPAGIFAFMKIFPLILCSIGFMLLAWRFFPLLIWLSLFCTLAACYRFIYIRNIRYLVSPEIIRITQGIFLKRVDQVELYRIKDYILTRPFMLQLFRLMDLELRSTDPVNPIIWLRGIPYSDLIDTIRAHVQEARQHNRIYEIN
jgi:membrane protein YdbS with pleckstrin-like domain